MDRIAIVGSRDFRWEEQVRAFVHLLPDDLMIVSGGARGPDSWAIDEAKKLGRSFAVFPAYWERYGKRAGTIRNEKIASYSDAMVAFWDSDSRGTLDSIRKMQALGKPTYVVSETVPPPTVDLILLDLKR